MLKILLSEQCPLLASCGIEREKFYPGPGLEPALCASALPLRYPGQVLIQGSYQSNALCWLVVELKGKNSILDRDLNPALCASALPLCYPGQVLIQGRINLLCPVSRKLRYLSGSY